MKRKAINGKTNIHWIRRAAFPSITANTTTTKLQAARSQTIHQIWNIQIQD
jgi:hypothetical protein